MTKPTFITRLTLVSILAFNAGLAGGAINNTADNVVLDDAAANEYIQLVYNGDLADNPPDEYTGFSAGATRVGAVEEWGDDADGVSLVRHPAGDTNVVLHHAVSTENARPGGATTANGDGFGNCGDPATLIHAVQGSGTASPEVGNVHVIEGVVIGDFQEASQLEGFFLQEEDGDADANPATSEGIFVYDHAFGVDVSVGDVVRVQGTVSEYYDHTQLGSVTHARVCPGGATATAATIALPIADVADWEHNEGMLVTIPQTLYVTEHYNQGRYGEVDLAIADRLYQPTQFVEPGAQALAFQAANDRRRIQLDDGSTQQNPDPAPYMAADNTLRAGDTLSGLTGVLGYAFGEYEIHPTEAISFTRANPRPTRPPWVGGRLKVASFNVLNYFTTIDTGTYICGPSGNMECRGADSAAEFARQRAKIISALAAMDADIVGLIEIENSATTAIQNLVDGLNVEMGAGTYAFINTGTIGTDAIRVALIYKPGTVEPVGPYAILDSTVDPAFIDTKNRPVLAQTFRESASGQEVTVVVNHLKSKGSACDDVGDPDLNDGQGNCNLTRTKAAQALGDWLATDPTGSGDADFSIIGNLNAYQMEDPITALKDAGYTDLLAVHAIDLAYSYVFDGQFGYLDHALASRTMALQVTSVALWSINADEPRALDYNDYNQPGLYSPDVYRSSDHDPVLVGLELRDVPPMPSDPVPPHGATGVPIDQRLSWRGVTSYDPVTYTVAFGTSTPPPIVGITHRPQYTPTLVEYTDYYWSVTVSDGLGTTAGPIWTFSTAGFEYLYLPLVLNDSR